MSAAAAADTDLPSIAALDKRFTFAAPCGDRTATPLLGSGRSGSVLGAQLRGQPVAIKVYRNVPTAINDAARELLILLVLHHQGVSDCVPRVRQAFLWKPLLDEHIRSVSLDRVPCRQGAGASHAVFVPGQEYCVLVTQWIPDTMTLHAFGTELRAMCAEEKTAVVRQLLRSAAAALRSMHRIGVVHRDIKPSNMLVRRQKRFGDSDAGDKVTTGYSVIFIDFGYAALRLPNDDAQAAHLSVSARPDVGTPMYMAPELLSACFRNKRTSITWDVAAAADWWALGASLLYAACGTSVLPHVRTLRRHCEEAERYDGPPLTLYADAPDVNDVLCQLLARDPNERSM